LRRIITPGLKIVPLAWVFMVRDEKLGFCQLFYLTLDPAAGYLLGEQLTRQGRQVSAAQHRLVVHG